MLAYTSKDYFFNSIPVFVPKDDMNDITENSEPKNIKELEEDVKIEEEYLNYLFHYKPSA